MTTAPAESTAPGRAQRHDTWHPRGVRRFGIIVLLGLLCAGCAAGPSTRPDFAIAGHTEGTPGETGTQAPAPPAPPETPTHEPSWRACPEDPAAGLAPGPDGLSIECARIAGALDPATSQSNLAIDLTRASTAATPDDAAPVVLVAGTDQSSRRALAELATGPSADLLAEHPVVAVDRRGMGPSTDPDCYAGTDGADLTRAGTGGDPLARAQSMMDAVTTATVSCTDVLRPAVDAFDAVHAASDVETLRSYWGVDRIAMLAVGAGSDVALAYAANVPEHVARMVLDSPAPVRLDAPALAERRAQADQAALARFEADCAATGCALGPDPAGMLATLLDSARSGIIRGVSEGSVLTVIRQTLADAGAPWDERVRRLGDLLHGAATGDVDSLRVFADAQAISSGAFAASCSDAPPPATPAQSEKAQSEWSQRYPVFGADSAVRMLTCAAWPSHQDPALPDKLDIPVLLYSGAADPVAGTGSVDSVNAALTRTGTTTSTVSWEGVGHGVLWNSTCATKQLGRYLGGAALPPNGTACPA